VAQTQAELLSDIYSQATAALRADENASVDVVLGAYSRAQTEIIAYIMGLVDDPEIQLTLPDLVQSGRWYQLLDVIHQASLNAADKAGVTIHNATVDQFYKSYDYSAYALDQATPPNIDVAYAPPPENAVRLLANTPYQGRMFSERIGIITDEMATGIKDELLQGLVQGETMQDMADRVSDIIGASDPDNPSGIAARSRTIARTEIMRIQNYARDLTFEQNQDVVEDEEWQVAPDDKLCDWCFRRDGLTDEEIEKTDPGDDPWGNSTDQPLHPNCRCDSVPRLKSWKDLLGLDMPEDFADDERGIRDEDGKWEIAPVQSFADWKESRQSTSGGDEG
jgi:SPP1 gp7 family putative phage head morphogenesis protein